ncbi:hypothetical protein LNP18_03500 [Leuconostoc citreum]|uniref:hypothetical protein n=1 Tax=Leuconostoc citreum TaxID=33964 RepID=UPI00200A5379|nr:hypothetical protein [Leuconostoc citreum]MCK8605165.1 hypothetical protein [Leuconostoc citreum]
MTETVVHVTTLEQWKSVLDVWFAQGYEWRNGGKGYRIDLFVKQLGRHLKLNANHKISYWSMGICGEPFIEYADFMAQQEKTITKETYYVTQEQLDFIERIKDNSSPFNAITIPAFSKKFNKMLYHFDEKKIGHYYVI